MQATKVVIYQPDGSKVELAEGPMNQLKVTTEGDSIKIDNAETRDEFHGMPWHVVWKKPKPNEERWEDSPNK